MNEQKEKVKVHYVEIPLEVKNIYYDSVRTDDGDVYFGKIDDPVFGKNFDWIRANYLRGGSDIPPIPGNILKIILHLMIHPH